MYQAEAAHHLRREVPFLAAEGGAAGEGNPLRAVDRVARPILRHEAGIVCQWSEPGARYNGFSTRRALVASCMAVAPFGQSLPSLTGLSGLPSICSRWVLPSEFVFV